MSKNRMIISVAMVVALFSMGGYAQKATGIVKVPQVNQVKPPVGDLLCPECGTGEYDTLVSQFGIYPTSLPGYTDQEAIAGLVANYNDPLFRRISIARMYLWDKVLRYEIFEGPNGFEIPSDGFYNTWRVATITHPVTHQTNELVYWKHVDDSSWAIFFLPNSTEVSDIFF